MAREWYRNEHWDSTIEADFEARLKRARGTFSKAQYIYIQGLMLLSSADAPARTQGICLLQRVIAVYPMEEMAVANAHETLGRHFLSIGNYDAAENHLRAALMFSIARNRSGTSGIVDLFLVEVIFKSMQTEKYPEAYSYIIKYPLSELMFNHYIFYHAMLGAQLCDAMGKRKKARAYASKALAVAEITKPQLSRHPTVGLVNISDEQKTILQRIAKHD